MTNIGEKVVFWFTISGIISVVSGFFFEAFPDYKEYEWIIVVPLAIFMIYLIALIVSAAEDEETENGHQKSA